MDEMNRTHSKQLLNKELEVDVHNHENKTFRHNVTQRN